MFFMILMIVVRNCVWLVGDGGKVVELVFVIVFGFELLLFVVYG